MTLSVSNFPNSRAPVTECLEEFQLVRACKRSVSDKLSSKAGSNVKKLRAQPTQVHNSDHAHQLLQLWQTGEQVAASFSACETFTPFPDLDKRIPLWRSCSSNR